MDSDPLWFVNRCAVDSTLVDRVASLLDSLSPPSARALLELSVLAESYVLHDGLVLVGTDGLALSSDGLVDAFPGTAIQALGARGGFQNEDAERYTSVVLETAGISFDDLHPDLASLQAAWDDEEQEAEERREERPDEDLDEYELRVREAERDDAAADEDADWYGWPGDFDYWQYDPDFLVQQRARRTGIPRLDEAATAMGLSLVQSPLDSLDSLSARIQTPVTVDLYRKLADYYRVSVEQLLRFQGVRQAYIPPVLAIILARCQHRGRGDIPRLLGDLREELAGFREKCATLQRAMLLESTLAGQFAVCAELDAVQAEFIRTVGKGHGRFIYQAWDVVKKGSALGILTTGLDKVIEHDTSRRLHHHWQAYFDLWRSATLVASHASLIRQVFGADVPDAGRLVQLANRTSDLEAALRRSFIELPNR